MASAVPCMVYAIVGPASPIAARIAGFGALLSTAPFQFMIWVHHDLFYTFLSVLLLLLAVRYLRQPTVGRFYVAMFAMLLLMIARPAGNLLVLPFLAVMVFVHRQFWRHYLAGILLVMATVSLYAVHRTILLGVNAAGDRPSYAGRQLFYNLYVNSARYGVRIDDGPGPMTSTLLRNAREFTDAIGLESSEMRAWYDGAGLSAEIRHVLFAQYRHSTVEFMRALSEAPGQDYFEYLCTAQVTRLNPDPVGKRNGVYPDEGDRLFLGAAKEVFIRHPALAVRFTLRNLGKFFWDPGYKHGRVSAGPNQFQKEGLFFIPFGRNTALQEVATMVPEPGRGELLRSRSTMSDGMRGAAERFVKLVWTQGNYRLMTQATTILALIAAISILVASRRDCGIALITLLLVAYNALVTSAFVDPDYRYHLMVLPLHIALAGIGLAALGRWILAFSLLRRA